MDGINLLPWREERRRVRDRQMLIIAIGIWVGCALTIFGVCSYYQILQDNQKKRNEYLTIEIQKLESKMKEIKQLKEKKGNLIARMEVIQKLQRERIQVVHLFDDVVRKMPDGVFFQSMTKKKNRIGFTGTARSNARISSLMNRLDSSEWFTDPDLKVINMMPSEGVRLSQFDLKVSQETKKEEKMATRRLYND